MEAPLIDGSAEQAPGASYGTEQAAEPPPATGQRPGTGGARGRSTWGVPQPQRTCPSSAWRLVDRRGAFRQASGGLRVTRLGRSRALYMKDMFHTLVDSPLRTVIFVFCALYLGTILVFSFVFWALSALVPQCGALGIADFKSAWAFSLETIMTIGYAYPGHGDYFTECNSTLVMITLESVIGVILDAVAVGLLYARLSRAQTRACTIVFSDFAVMRRVQGRLCFLFQVCEMRKHQLVEAHVRCYALSRHQGPGGAVTIRTDVMRTARPDDELGGMLFLALPNIVSHAIDEFSPLRPQRAPFNALSHAARRNEEATEEQGSADATDAAEEADAADAKEDADVREHLAAHKVEIIVVVEGIDAVTSDTIQARHSYCVTDIVWDHDFAPCASEGANGELIINFDRFHELRRADDSGDETMLASLI